MIKPGYAHWANFYHGAVSIFSGSHSRRTWSKVHSTAALCPCCAAHWLPPRLTAIDFSKLWFWQLELGNFPTKGKRKKKNWSLGCSHRVAFAAFSTNQVAASIQCKIQYQELKGSYQHPPALGQTLSGSSPAYFIPMTSKCSWFQFTE